jgi:hypothetical protein
MLILGEETKKDLIELSKDRGIYLEGNILKVIDVKGDEEFAGYVQLAIENDRENRRKRLEVTKKVQEQNKELVDSQKEKDELMNELKDALQQAESAKQEAQNDLDMLQKKTQFELIGQIVTVALWIIMGVGVITTALFVMSILTGSDTTLIGNTWSNLFGILLTNSFSIIGTIMGVKYSSEASRPSKTEQN